MLMRTAVSLQAVKADVHNKFAKRQHRSTLFANRYPRVASLTTDGHSLTKLRFRVTERDEQKSDRTAFNSSQHSSSFSLRPAVFALDLLLPGRPPRIHLSLLLVCLFLRLQT